MKSKVTLKELVGTKIIYAVLLVCYYWMWARQDWHEYYVVIQNVVCVFTVVIFAMQASRIRKYSKEEKDEMAVQNLRRADAVSLKIMMIATIIIAFACGVTFLNGQMAGYTLVGLILVLTVIRFIMFCIMDSKGV